MAKLSLTEQRILLILEKYSGKYITSLTLRRELNSIYSVDLGIGSLFKTLDELENWSYIILKDEKLDTSGYKRRMCTITETGIKALPLEA